MPAPYEKLWTYRFSLVVHDLTVVFCKRFILRHGKKNSLLEGKADYRSADQMIQAARSAKQNIVEGSAVLNTSLKSAIKLTNVAKGSCEELIEDYQDFLRQRGFATWNKHDPKVIRIRDFSSELVRNSSDLSILSNRKLPRNPEVAANTLLTLCHQLSYLLHKQVISLEMKHETEGGFTEKLYNRRKQQRGY